MLETSSCEFQLNQIGSEFAYIQETAFPSFIVTYSEKEPTFHHSITQHDQKRLVKAPESGFISRRN